MPVAVAVWSLALSPGEPHEFIPQGDLVITNVALGEEIADKNSRTTVKLTYIRPVSVESDEEEDEEDGPANEIETTVLCSLTPDKIEQASVNITLEADEEFLFQAAGKNTVYLTGNYIDQSPDQVPYNDDSEPEDEDDFDLRDVSSDVEIDPEELAGIVDDNDDDESDSGRFEEVDEDEEEEDLKAETNVKRSAPLKRPRESDVMDADKPSKDQEKKTKKQKAANGEAVPAADESAADASKPAEPVHGKKDKKQKKKEKKEAAQAAAAGVQASKDVSASAAEGETKVLPSGLKIQDVKVGTGPQAKPGQTVSMRYVGKLSSGKIFDSNTKGKPFTFKLGKGEVIKGWDEGIKGMRVGGERLLIVPPQLGYGKQATSGIPPNSTLTFETKLLSIN